MEKCKCEICTAKREEVIDIAEKFILDPCSGGRMFWDQKEHPNVIFGDIRELPKGSIKQRPEFFVKPDQIMDFKELPFPDQQFKLVVFDPPHLKSLGEKSWMRMKYGILGPQWKDDLKKGFSECWRVLAYYGVLIFKWSEAEIKTSELYELFPAKPLFGHPINSKSKTIWMCFMKIPEVKPHLGIYAEVTGPGQ